MDFVKWHFIQSNCTTLIACSLFFSSFFVIDRVELLEMSYTRSFQLRRQYSAACESIERQQLSTSKDRRGRLQKQLSADQSAFIRDAARPMGYLRRPKTSTPNTKLNDGLPETSLRVFTAIKSKNSLIQRNCEPTNQNKCVYKFYMVAISFV